MFIVFYVHVALSGLSN